MCCALSCRFSKGAGNKLQLGLGLASVDENGELGREGMGVRTRARDAKVGSPGASSDRAGCSTAEAGDALLSGCLTARGELDSLRHYCPPERKSKNVLFTPR